MSRRGAGEGSIYKDGSLWVATVELGRDPVTGRRQRRKVKAKTKAEALRRAKVMREQLDAGITPDGTLTVTNFLDQWLETVVAARVGADRTVTDYKSALAHIKRSLGTVPLIRLTPDQVDEFLKSKADAGLSRSYVGRMRMLLADALTHAQHRGLVARNVAKLSIMPKCQPKAERKPYTAEELLAVLRAAQGHRLECLFTVGLHLGLRPGELRGLRWEDLDLEASPPTLSVTGSMKDGPEGPFLGPVKKSTAGNRTVELWPSLVTALKEHRARQAAERLRLGGLWNDHGLVFPSDTGTPIDASNLRHLYARIARKAGVSGVPYTMRHSVVSLLLDNGASIDQVADLTGDNPVTLYRHYRHRIQPVARAATLMARIVAEQDTPAPDAEVSPR